MSSRDPMSSNGRTSGFEPGNARPNRAVGTALVAQMVERRTCNALTGVRFVAGA